MMIHIVGGTGSLGGATARRLLSKGTAVRVMTRSPKKAVELQELGTEFIRGDLLDKASLGRPLKVSHVPLGLLKVMVRVLRSLPPGISRILQSNIYAETCDFSFNPAPLQAAYSVTLTRISEWAAQRVGQNAAVPDLDQA